MELSHESIELVVVDDASKDNTESICRELAAEFGEGRVRYVRLESNSGAPAARNRGLAEARGDLLMFIDSDDVPVAKGISEMLGLLASRPDLDFAYGKVLLTDDALRPLPGHEPVGSCYNGSNIEVGGYHWHTMGAMYRRDCAEKVGAWNTDLTGSQDWEYQARVKLSGARGEFLDQIVGLWRQHEGSRVGAKKFRPDYLESVMKSGEAVLREASRAGRADAALRQRLAKRLLVHAIEWGANGRAADKRRCCRQAAETAPGDLRVGVLAMLISHAPRFVDRRFCARLAARRRV